MVKDDVLPFLPPTPLQQATARRIPIEGGGGGGGGCRSAPDLVTDWHPAPYATAMSSISSASAAAEVFLFPF